MLNRKGFDEWAAGYDASVRHSHDAGEYPFAGYDAVLSLIEARVNIRPGADVLGLGFGTGMLTARLYAAGTAWDCGEDYAVAQRLAGALPSLRLSFARLSHCAGGRFPSGGTALRSLFDAKTANHRMSFIANR